MKQKYVSRRRRSGEMAALALCFCLLLAREQAGAADGLHAKASMAKAPLSIQFKTIHGDSPSPLERIHIGEDMSFQAFHRTVPGNGQIYPSHLESPADMGIFVRVNGTLYGPDFARHGASAAPSPSVTPWSAESFGILQGSGDEADRYRCTIVADAADTGLRLTLNVYYANAHDYFVKSMTFSNLSDLPISFDAFLASDLYLARSDTGVPRSSYGQIGGDDCSDLGFSVRHIPITPADRFTASHFNDVWSQIVGGDLDNSVGAACVDNGAALQWSDVWLQPQEAVSILAATSFGNLAELLVLDTFEDDALLASPLAPDIGDYAATDMSEFTVVQDQYGENDQAVVCSSNIGDPFWLGYIPTRRVAQVEIEYSILVEFKGPLMQGNDALSQTAVRGYVDCVPGNPFPVCSEVTTSTTLAWGSDHEIRIKRPDSRWPFDPPTYSYTDTGFVWAELTYYRIRWDIDLVNLTESIQINGTTLIENEPVNSAAHFSRLSFESNQWTERFHYLDNVVVRTPTQPSVTPAPPVTSMRPSVVLDQNVPNPFNPSTSIRLRTDAVTPLRLEVFNARGRLVKTLWDDAVGPGEIVVRWDGTNRGGEQVATGVYYYRAITQDSEQVRRMVLLK